MNDLKIISTDAIHPHPNNPRKDLGDLTELADSIRQNGVMQNLTVVPVPGKYEFTVIIGHRRLAAAKLAGLKEVPCVIAILDEKEQISTMLLENIQRSNLTPLEEADGFQMMLDFGDDFAEISKSTGVSETTIRRRVKLLELDREKMEKSLKRQVTLEQYGDVLALEDEKARNEALDVIGTDNYNFTIRRLKEVERTKKECSELLAGLAQKYIFKEREDLVDLVLVKNVGIFNKDFPKEDSGAKYYAKAIYGAGYEIYRDKTAEDEEKTERAFKLKAEKNAVEEEFEQLKYTAYKNRRAFMNLLTEKDLQRKSSVLAAELINILIHLPRYGLSVDCDDIADAFGIDENEFTDEEIADELLKSAGKKPNKAQAAVIYALHGDSEDTGYDDFNLKYKENAELDNIYEFLKKLGYSMSDTEKNLQNGTHALFAEADKLTQRG